MLLLGPCHFLTPHNSVVVARGVVGMTEPFAQVADPADSIRAILAQYPQGTVIFRELLQNSDDAGATEQVTLVSCSYAWSCPNLAIDIRS